MPKKTVIIIGTFGGDIKRGIRIYNEPVPEGAEIWGCSMSYLQQPDLSRSYTLDPLTGFRSEELEKLKVALAARPIPFICQRYYPEIPTSIPYPKKEIVKAFGIDYFTSTVSYMIAHAIYEGYEKIIIHRVHTIASFIDYISQKPCVDAWCFFAMARGVEVAISEDSHICRPYPWQSHSYGYEEAPGELAFNIFFAGIGHFLLKAPRLFIAADENAAHILKETAALARAPEIRKFTAERLLGKVLVVKDVLAPDDVIPEGSIELEHAYMVPEDKFPLPIFVTKSENNGAK